MLNFYNRRIVEKKMRESIRKDRARIQIGRISSFGLLEMTRQRLREGSIKWETNLSMESFALKIIKKIEMLAFTNKIKFINVNVPDKIKLYIDSQLSKEINYFENKYNFKIEFMGDPALIVPEYKIQLLNKNKKIVNKIENINKIDNARIDFKKNTTKVVKLTEEKKDNKNKKKLQKGKASLGRTLWVRKKKVS